jgi:hypothetical protein
MEKVAVTPAASSPDPVQFHLLLYVPTRPKKLARVGVRSPPPEADLHTTALFPCQRYSRLRTLAPADFVAISHAVLSLHPE